MSKFEIPVIFRAMLFVGSCLIRESTASQGDNTTLPYSLPTRVINATGQVCPPNEALMIERDGITQDIQYLLRNALIPCETFQTQANPAASCSELPARCSSGYYWVRNSNGTAVQVYCDMTRQCCDHTGGWTRISHLNMTDAAHQCPQAWREIASPRRACGRSTSATGGGCSSAYFDTHNINYTRVCGRLIGYQFGNTRAFRGGFSSLDFHYVDGVSITHGTPRQHIWTFAASPGETGTGSAICPCSNTANGFINVPSYVSQDYFCETGTPIFTNLPGIFYSSDPLWDGQGCGATSTCCQFNNPPWFCKQLPQATTDDIELRICAGRGYSDVDTPLELVEIYIH